MSSTAPLRFLIITPVRNEEQYLPTTIECMLRQTVLPEKWIIVNDGSTDGTAKIARRYAKICSFLDYLEVEDRGYRKPGAGVVETFYQGLNSVTTTFYDVIAKFDGDLEFPEHTITTISKAFNDQPKLGITGGTRYERSNPNERYAKVFVPRGFVGGPYKFYRKKCFDEIGGLIRRAGWDGVDNVKANMLGWQTGELETLKMIHLKPTGTAKGEGLARACRKYGDVSYYMGGYFWYFLLRVFGRSLYSRNPRIGIYMLRGYFGSKIKRLPRESQRFRNFLKAQQVENLNYWLKNMPCSLKR